MSEPADVNEPLSERLFYASGDLLRKVAPPSSSGGRKRGFFRALFGLLRAVVFLVLLLFLPLFWLPLLVARLFHFGRYAVAEATTVDVTSGEAARWDPPSLDNLPNGQANDAEVAAISARDPGFAPDVLQRWAADAAALIEQSLTTGDVAPVRPVMASGLLRTHQALMELRARADVTLEGSWQARSADVVHVARTPLVELVQVRVACEGWCIERHTPTGLTIRGGPDPAIWWEQLTFGRSAKATTPPGGGLPAHLCPSCGAPLTLDLSGACTYCRGVVTAGRYDWVLVGWEREPW